MGFSEEDFKNWLRPIVNSGPARTIGAMGAGAQNLPLDVGRYAELLASWGAGKMMGVSPEKQQAYYDEANQKYDNPAIFPDAYNQYRQGLMQEHPNAAAAGEIIAGGVAPAAWAKQGSVSLARNRLGKGLHQIIPRGPMDPIRLLGRNHSRAEIAGKAGALTGVGELGLEPILNKYLYKEE